MMKAYLHRSGVGIMAVLGWLSFQPAHAATQTETIPLNYGWNAVWLSVEPLDDNDQSLTVDQVFQGDDFAIDVVARAVEAVRTTEFVTDPAVTINQAGWLVWYANPVSGENDIFPVSAHAAYLVHVAPTAGNDGEPAGSISVSGNVSFFKPTWRAGTYNLIGFNVAGTVTFNDYLEALGDPAITTSGGLPVVQRLDSTTGSWVGAGGSEAIGVGQAYWVWAPTRLADHHYAGPVAVRIEGLDSVDFGTGPGTIEVPDPQGTGGDTLLLSRAELTFANLDPATSHDVTLTKISPDNDDLRLFALEPDLASLTWNIPADSTAAPISTWPALTLAAETTRTISIGADRNWNSGSPDRENLYRIDVSLSSGSCFFWLLVEAARADLPAVDSSVQEGVSPRAGLWVGEVLLDRVTSLAESGSPLEETTSILPMELILHCDGTNAPVLLSHVLFMKTKSADEDIPTEPVLVVDEALIPYYEGIEERDGKRVGRRIESAAYDMPRRMDPVTQSALASAQSLATTEAIASYVNGQTTRPSELVEEYHLTWPLMGVLGPNGVVRTASTTEGDDEDLPLLLDPFHRSNPFRHAFHPSHGAGYPITRSFLIYLDKTNEDGLLQGTYEETVTGLTASANPLVVAGSIVLRRVTDIAALH